MCIPVERQSAGGAQRSAGSGRRIARRSHAGRDRVALWFAVPVVGQASGHVLHARVCHLPPASCSFPAAAARIVAPRPRHAPSRASRRGGMLQSPELRREQRDCNVTSRSIILITMRALLGIKPCLQSFGSPCRSIGSQLALSVCSACCCARRKAMQSKRTPLSSRCRVLWLPTWWTQRACTNAR